MTPEEIRSLYMETLARAELASVSFIAHDGIRSTAMRTNEDAAQAALDALTAAGLLPTSEEVFSCFPDEPEADDEMMRRYVTGWREASK